MHARTSRLLSLLAVASLALAAAPAAPAAAQAGDASLTIERVDGRPAGHPAPVTGDSLTVTGSAALPAPPPPPALFADAGDSQFVEQGRPAHLSAIAVAGTPPYEYRWRLDGAGDRFADPRADRTVFDTSGLSGEVTLTLEVTDAEGVVATDTVKHFVWEPVREILVSETSDVAPGVPDEVVGLNGSVDQASQDFPFTVAEDRLRLEVFLEWGDPANDLDLRFEDPSGEHDRNFSGATGNMPEEVSIASPAAGDWTVWVDAFLNEPDTFRLEVATVAAPDNPVPAIRTPGPFRFEVGETQLLTAEVTGGTEPFETAWDLDFDGVFETPGTEVQTDFPLGRHLVAVKTTDAVGYEEREVTAVRVVEPGSTGGTSPFVVIGVSDTGINPYHQEFSAATYPDPEVLEITQDFTLHPSTYLPGYPKDAPALDVTLGQGYLPPADQGLWTTERIARDTLYWIPGTKIIGAIDAGDGGFGIEDPRPILDDHGHGTSASSVALGNTLGFCPRCLLVFVENPAPDRVWAQDWIDISSNSFGQGIILVPGGTAGLLLDVDERGRDAANRGQLIMYAGGNGVLNAFVIPHDTVTHEDNGPDWVVRVGAIHRETRKAIVGTGKPVDIASFGSGLIPSAAHNSEKGTRNFGGTSAATPYSAGVFGDVLGRVRVLLGDERSGQRPDVAPGVVAAGQPVATSPFLNDGTLTLAELEEAVFKTAEHDDAVTVNVLPTAVPGNVLLEGYGIVEPASGDRAFAVLTGDAPLPDRALEDDFFAVESELRRELYGDWNGGGANPGGTSSPSSSTGAFADITPEDVADPIAALQLLADAGGPFHSQAVLDAALAAAAGGETYWLHHQGGCTADANPGPFMDRTNSTGDDDGCGAAGLGGVTGNDVESFPSTVESGVSIPEGTDVNGAIYLTTWEPAPLSVRVTLLAGGRVVGQGESEVVPVVNAPAVTSWTELPFSFATTGPVAVGESLTLNVAVETTATWFFGYEDDHASFFTIAVDGGGDPVGDLFATITSPADGASFDAAATPTIPVTGEFGFPAQLGPTGAERFFLRRDDCGAGAADNLRLTTVDGPDEGSGCGFIPGASAWGKVIPASDDFPVVEEHLPVTLGPGRVEGTLFYQAEIPSPVAEIEVTLATVTAAGREVIGSQRVSGVVIGFPVEDIIEFPFAFDVAEEFVGAPLDNLTLTVHQREAQGGMFLELDDPPSFVDLPLSESAMGAGRVEVAVDDPGFASPLLADLGDDGTWGLSLDLTGLGDGEHTLLARAVQADAASEPDAVTISVTRSGVGAVVEVQLVPTGTEAADDGWVPASDTSSAGDWSSWAAQLDVGGLPPGDYDLLARLVVDGDVVALDGPVPVRLRGGGKPAFRRPRP